MAILKRIEIHLPKGPSFFSVSSRWFSGEVYTKLAKSNIFILVLSDWSKCFFDEGKMFEFGWGDGSYTLPETNIAPENTPLEKEKHLQTTGFWVPC